MTKELTKKENFNLTQADEEALALMQADAEVYQDDTSAEDLAMPRLVLLQSNSKPCKKSEPEYVKGAEEGDLYNSLTRKVVAGDEGVYFVPVKRRVVYLHWRDVDSGGGLIESFGEDPTEFMKVEPNEKGRRRTSENTEIVKTYETFGYVVDRESGEYSEVLLSLASTQAKKQKRFNSLIRSLTLPGGKQAPEYAGLYKITTTPESNDQGSWYTFEFTAAGWTLAIPNTGKMIYESAKNFADMVKADDVNVKYEQDEVEVDEETVM